MTVAPFVPAEGVDATHDEFIRGVADRRATAGRDGNGGDAVQQLLVVLDNFLAQVPADPSGEAQYQAVAGQLEQGRGLVLALVALRHNVALLM